MKRTHDPKPTHTHTFPSWFSDQDRLRSALYSLPSLLVGNWQKYSWTGPGVWKSEYLFSQKKKIIDQSIKGTFWFVLILYISPRPYSLSPIFGWTVWGMFFFCLSENEWARSITRPVKMTLVWKNFRFNTIKWKCWLPSATMTNILSVCCSWLVR